MGDGAGAGGVVGGATVGFGGVVGAGALVCAAGALVVGAPVAEDDDAEALGLGPAGAEGGTDEEGVDGEPVAVFAALLANRLAMPKTLTTLSSVARQVILDSLTSPESRAAPRLRCLMGLAQQEQG